MPPDLVLHNFPFLESLQQQRLRAKPPMIFSRRSVAGFSWHFDQDLPRLESIKRQEALLLTLSPIGQNHSGKNLNISSIHFLFLLFGQVTTFHDSGRCLTRLGTRQTTPTWCQPLSGLPWQKFWILSIDLVSDKTRSISRST